MAALFGTDGVRGLANEHLTPELALQLAQAAAVVLSESATGRPVAVVGRDTRISGQMLEAAMVAGLTSVGVDVQLVGILPTPAIAFLTDFLGADLGVVISVSHNQMPDNGIKFLARGGEKLADETEIAIAAHLGGDFDRPVGAALGAVETYQGSDYQQHLLSVLQHKLTGLKVVLDCAHGAASQVGPEVFQAAGAEVVVINADPDGLNINLNCGSTHLEGLQAAVVAEKADLGFGFDGDADRCLAVAADGEIVDGDQILAILALGMQRADQLKQQTVVATVMSNLGFKIAMEAAGVKLRETQVGDRYVLAEMQANGFNLGGEQSGHVIVSDHATTGDGVLTALLVAEQVITQQKSLLELAAVMTKLPQVLINVPEVDKSRVNDPIVQTEVAAATAELGNRGRVLLRASGTENLVRVMVEAATENQAQEIAQHLAEVIRVQLG